MISKMFSLYLLTFATLKKPKNSLEISSQLLQWHISDCRPPGCESAAERGARQSHANRKTHGARRQLQELQQQAGLDVWVCHRGKPALQGGPGHPGEGAGEGERRLRARSLWQLLSSTCVAATMLSLLHTTAFPLNCVWTLCRLWLELHQNDVTTSWFFVGSLDKEWFFP